MRRSVSVVEKRHESPSKNIRSPASDASEKLTVTLPFWVRLLSVRSMCPPRMAFIRGASPS